VNPNVTEVDAKAVFHESLRCRGKCEAAAAGLLDALLNVGETAGMVRLLGVRLVIACVSRCGRRLSRLD
jgi:hypothetical protein